MFTKIEYDRQQRKIPALSGSFRTEALDHLSGEMASVMEAVKERFFSGRKGSEGLEERSGETKAGWKLQVRNRASGGALAGSVVLSNDKIHGDPRKDTTIRMKDKLLAIPLPPALDSRGSKRFSGPRASGVPKNIKFFQSKAGNKLLIPMSGPGKRKRLLGAPWWVLKEEVTVPGYAKGLDTFVYTQTSYALANTSRFIAKLLRGKP